jgi:CRP/FNR family transcriptional regulator
METLQRIWYSKKESIIQQLAPDEILLLNRHAQRIQKERGEIFWLEDLTDETPHVFIQDQGFVRMCRSNDEGKRLISEILGPSDIFGQVVPGLSSPGDEAYAEVVRDARIIAINSEVFQEVLQHHPKMMLRLVQILETRRRAMDRRIYSALCKDLCARVAELLVEIGSKYGEACPTAPDDDAVRYRDIHLTHQEIADLLGAARPTVSAIISDMVKAGILDKHKQLLCLSQPAALATLAESGMKALEGYKARPLSTAKSE